MRAWTWSKRGRRGRQYSSVVSHHCHTLPPKHERQLFGGWRTIEYGQCSQWLCCHATEEKRPRGEGRERIAKKSVPLTPGLIVSGRLPVEPVPLRVCLILTTFLKPRVLVRAVVDHQVEQDLEAVGMRRGNELLTTSIFFRRCQSPRRERVDISDCTHQSCKVPKGSWMSR